MDIELEKKETKLAPTITTLSTEETRELLPSTPIEDLVRFIVVERLRCGEGVDYGQWVDKLKDNLITTLGLLCRVSPVRLEKLGLPLLLEEELVYIIKASVANGEGGPRPLVVLKDESKHNKFNRQHKSSASDHRSAFLGLTEIERQTILQSWNAVLETQGNEITVLFEKFYQTFFRLDKTARRLFQGRSLDKQSKSLTKVVKMIMSTLEDPTTMLPYVQRLGARHLIYGVSQKDFQSWAIAFTQTLSEYVPNIMTPNLKEAWFILILKLGQTMTESYEEIMQGYRCCLGKTNDKEKKKLYCLLTHQSLAIYKDEEMTKETTTIWIKWVTDIDIITDEKYTKFFPHCFAITIGDIKFYYGVETKEDLVWWITELGERVTAHHHIAADDDEMSDSASAEFAHSSNGISKKDAHKLKKLKKKLLKSKMHQSTTSMSIKET